MPLIANGDILSEEDAVVCLAQSGADGVMVGRGAYGRPWLPGFVAHYLSTGDVNEEPEGEELLDLVLEHYESMIDYYPDVVGVRCARKHLGWYMDGVLNASVSISSEISNLRKVILTADDAETVRIAMREFFSVAAERHVA